MLLLLLVACLASAAHATEIECYSCRGVITRAPNCGAHCTDVVDPEVCGEVLNTNVQTNTTTCDGVCQTKSTYHLEQKVYMDRECVPECEDACFLTFGTGACFSCCDTDLCNISAAGSNTASLWLLGVAAIVTSLALGFSL